MKPNYLKITTDSFPKNLKSDVKKVFSIISLETKYRFHLTSCDSYNVKVSGEIVEIPYRIYFDESKLQNENQLTDTQKDILNCLFTRHHNGFVREKRLSKITEKLDHWKIPFIVQLLGEYIYELFPIIDKKVNDDTLDYYREFKNENPKYWQQTESRIISYWNEYYRRAFPKLEEYLGTEIINRIKKEVLDQ